MSEVFSSPAPRVCIVTINWNGLADTLECLTSLRGDTYANKRVIVVDNGSSDDSVAVIRRQFPEVTVLEAGCNLGFTGANNLGLLHAMDAKYIYWLNNDTLSDPHAVEALVSAAEAEARFGILTPLIRYFDPPREPWFAGSRIELDQGIAVHDNEHPPATHDASFEIPWASGCAMFARVDLMRELGGFDDRFFLNWEDVDLSLRTRAAGRSVGLVPSARIDHKIGRSFATAGGTGAYYSVRNNLLLVRLHAPARGRWKIQWRVIDRHLRSGLRALRRREPHSFRGVLLILRGVTDYLMKRHGPLK